MGYLYQYLLKNILEEGNFSKLRNITEKVLKILSEEGFNVPSWRDINNVGVENRNSDYSNYLNVFRNGEVISLRISDHKLSLKSKQDRTNAQIYINLDEIDDLTVQESVNKYIKNKIIKIIQLDNSINNIKNNNIRLVTNDFVKEYIIESSKCSHTDNSWFDKFLEKYSIPSYIKTFLWFKILLKNKCQKLIKELPELEKQYLKTGIAGFQNNSKWKNMDIIY